MIFQGPFVWTQTNPWFSETQWKERGISREAVLFPKKTLKMKFCLQEDVNQAMKKITDCRHKEKKAKKITKVNNSDHLLFVTEKHRITAHHVQEIRLFWSNYLKAGTGQFSNKGQYSKNWWSLLELIEA